MDRRTSWCAKRLVSLALAVAFTAALAIPTPAVANPALTTVATATQSATLSSVVQTALTWIAGLLPQSTVAGSQGQSVAPPDFGQTTDPDGHR